MAVGDDALAAGFPLVPHTGTGAEVKNGYLEINRTRDFVANVKSLISAVWAVNKGGTGATTAGGARTNLGIRTGTAAPSDANGGATDGNIYLKIQTLSASISRQNSASIQTGGGAGSDSDGRLRIIVKQVTQDWAHMTSEVNVQGIMENNNNRRVDNQSGPVERDISGYASYTPSDFNFNIAGNGQLVYISHTFTVPHDEDGTKSVHFNVHYGGTGTATFDHDKQAGVSLTLDPITIGGVWIRKNGDWLHAIPHVRHNKDWPIATAFIRDGGAWKPLKLIEGKNGQETLRVLVSVGDHLSAGYRNARLGSPANLGISIRPANRRDNPGCRHVSWYGAACRTHSSGRYGRNARRPRNTAKDDIFTQCRSASG